MDDLTDEEKEEFRDNNICHTYDKSADYQQNPLFADTLNSVVLDMTRQYFARENDYVNDFFHDLDHPELDKTEPLLHGYIPGTGYNNREAIILDSISFVKTNEQFEMLAVAILEASEYVGRLIIYKVVNGHSNQVMLLDLGDTPFKVGQVSSQFDSSIILLYNSSSGFKVQYIEKDLETLVINGFGYVAVANSSTCLVLKLDWFLRSHTQLKALHADDIRDLQSFRVGFEHFFTIISSQEQHLLVWRSGEFHTRQFLKFPNATQIYTAPVSSCRDDVFAVLFQDTILNRVSLLVWQKEERLVRVPPQILQSSPKDIQLLTGSITSFIYKKTVYLLAVDRRKGSRLFSLHTSLKPLPNPVFTRVMELKNFINHVESRFEENERNLQHLLHIFEHAVVDSENVFIFEYQVFIKMNILHRSVGVLELLENLGLEGSQQTVDDFKWTVDSLARNLRDIEQNMEVILSTVKDVALSDETVLMTGTNKIRAVQATSLGSLFVDVGNIAATNMNILQKSIYRSDNPEIVKGEKTFVSPIAVRRSVEVGCCVNNFDVARDILTTDKAQASTAYYYMMMPMIIQKHLDISGRVNNVDLLKDLVTLYKKHQIRAHVTMKDDIYIYGDLTVKIIDGTDVKEMKRFSLTGNRTQTMSSKEFVHDVRVQDVTITGVLNDVELNMLATNIVRINIPTIISGKKAFKESFSVVDKLSVVERVDTLKLPSDLFTSNCSQNIMVPKTFQGPLLVMNIYVNGLVDHLNTSDAVTLTVEDSLYDKMFARGIGVEKDVIVGRLVDTVDVSTLTRIIKKDFHLPGNTMFLANAIVEKNLDVQKKINDLDVGRTYRDAIFKTEIVEIYSLKAFDALTVQSATVNTICGFNIKDFMLTSGNRKIRGTKFLDETKFSDLRSEANIADEVDLKLLEAERVSLSSHSTIQGHLDFFKVLLVENAVTETVDGVSIHNAVLVSLPQEIAKKTFKPTLALNRRNGPHLSARHMRVIGDVYVETTIDAYDLTELARKRITTSSNQDILVEAILGDNNAVLIEAERVNNYDLVKLSKNVMSLSKTQIVSEKNFEAIDGLFIISFRKNLLVDTLVWMNCEETIFLSLIVNKIFKCFFTGDISVFGGIGTSGGISNIRLDLVNFNAIQLNGDQTLSGHYTFLDVLPVVEHLNVRKLVNNVDLTDLVQDSVMMEGNHVLTKPIRFQSVLHIDGDINAILVNGIHLPHKLFTQTSLQVITGVFVFERGLGLSSNLLITGLINGIDVSCLSAMTMKLDQKNKIVGSLKFQNEIEMKNNLTISELVNGIKLSLLQTEAVLVNEKEQIISKSIANEVFVKANLMTNVVNNLDLEQFVADAIWVIGEQDIPTSKTFTEEVVVLHNLQVLGPSSVHVVDGIDLVRLARDAVYTDKARKIEDVKVFSNVVEVDGSILIHGRINNIDLSVGAITVTKTGDDIQRIYGEKLFTNVFFKDLVTVVETVNNHVLEEQVNDTLLKTGNQIVSGRKMIKGNILCEKDLHLMKVNNINLKEAVNLHTKQVIFGQLMFSGGVKSRNLYVQGLMNEVNVWLMVEEAIYLDTNQDIFPEFFFADLLVREDAIIGKKIDHIDLEKLDKAVVNFDIHFKAKTQDILDETRRQQLIGDYLWDVLEESLYHLDKFVFYTSLNITGDFVDVLPQTTDFNIVKIPRNSYYGRAYNFVIEHPKLLFLDSIFTSTTVRRVPFQILQRVFVINVAAPHSAVDTVIREREQPVASLGQGILDISVINLDESYCNIIVLDVEGTCKIYVFKMGHGYNALLTQVAFVHAGKEAIGMTAFTFKQEEVLIAVARKFPLPYTQGSSLLFKFSKRNIELVQEIAAPASDDVLYFQHCGKHYLAFTNDVPVHEALEPNSVKVYRSCDCLETPFRLHQKIYFDNPKSLEVFKLGRLHELYMIISNSTVIKFYHLQGEGGFVSNTTFVSDDIRDVKPFVAHGELYVVVVQGENSKSSMVLKAEMKGSTVPPRLVTHWP
ncbi:uncharacterized protein LOC111086391 [Limulus polyphemus]|uniref:Uncharacterized protein LOC111086391 n=1 Tax=Limulus polyphemus TaxID=6850 RepID=A0ABM1SM81_LIMPO|nr:uncharacterized protein LOC111086391 [Limulus polyphemus]